MLEQLSRAPRVLGGDHVALAQNAQRAQRDVLKVADGRSDEIKSAGGEWWQCGVHVLTNPVQSRTIPNINGLRRLILMIQNSFVRRKSFPSVRFFFGLAL